MGNKNYTLLRMHVIIMQVVVPIWILALYHAVAYAGAKFGGTQLWQQYGARLQQALSAYQVQPAATSPLCISVPKHCPG